jgi:hypothetical protein
VANAVAITGLQNITSVYPSEILFVNTEFSGNNVYVEHQSTKSLHNAWVPWCDNNSSFPSHHMEIIDVSDSRVLASIWQHRSADGDYVRVSDAGFVTPGVQLVVAGASYNIFVTAEGTVKANPA